MGDPCVVFIQIQTCLLMSAYLADVTPNTVIGSDGTEIRLLKKVKVSALMLNI